MACRLTGVDEERGGTQSEVWNGFVGFPDGWKPGVSARLRVRSAGCSVSQRVGSDGIEPPVACRIIGVLHHY